MKKLSEMKITRYAIDRHGFFFETVETRDEFEAWIGLENYGTMDFCFGLSKASTSREGFLDLLAADPAEEVAMFLMEHDEIDDPEILADYDYPLFLVRTRAQFCEDKSAIARELVAAGIDLSSDTWRDRIADLVQAYQEEYDVPEGFLELTCA